MKTLFDALFEALPQITTFILALFSALFVTWWNRRRVLWGDFLLVIAELRSELECTPINRVAEFYDSSKRALSKAVHLVRPHLSKGRWARLQREWMEYRNKNGETFWTREMDSKIITAFMTEQTCQTQGQYVDSLLGKFADCIPKL